MALTLHFWHVLEEVLSSRMALPVPAQHPPDAAGPAMCPRQACLSFLAAFLARRRTQSTPQHMAGDQVRTYAARARQTGVHLPSQRAFHSWGHASMGQQPRCALPAACCACCCTAARSRSVRAGRTRSACASSMCPGSEVATATAKHPAARAALRPFAAGRGGGGTVRTGCTHAWVSLAASSAKPVSCMFATPQAAPYVPGCRRQV